MLALKEGLVSFDEHHFFDFRAAHAALDDFVLTTNDVGFECDDAVSVAFIINEVERVFDVAQEAGIVESGATIVDVVVEASVCSAEKNERRGGCSGRNSQRFQHSGSPFCATQ